jgi:hypothetical protein
MMRIVSFGMVQIFGLLITDAITPEKILTLRLIVAPIYLTVAWAISARGFG